MTSGVSCCAGRRGSDARYHLPAAAGDCGRRSYRCPLPAAHRSRQQEVLRGPDPHARALPAPVRAVHAALQRKTGDGLQHEPGTDQGRPLRCVYSCLQRPRGTVIQRSAEYVPFATSLRLAQRRKLCIGTECAKSLQVLGNSVMPRERSHLRTLHASVLT